MPGGNQKEKKKGPDPVPVPSVPCPCSLQWRASTAPLVIPCSAPLLVWVPSVTLPATPQPRTATLWRLNCSVLVLAPLRPHKKNNRKMRRYSYTSVKTPVGSPLQEIHPCLSLCRKQCQPTHVKIHCNLGPIPPSSPLLSPPVLCPLIQRNGNYDYPSLPTFTCICIPYPVSRCLVQKKKNLFSFPPRKPPEKIKSKGSFLLWRFDQKAGEMKISNRNRNRNHNRNLEA